MNVAAVTVGAYDNAGLSIQGLRASRGEDPCAVSIPAASIRLVSKPGHSTPA